MIADNNKELLRELSISSVFAEVLGVIVSSFSINDLGNLILEKLVYLTQSEVGGVGYIKEGKIIFLSQTEDLWDRIYSISDIARDEKNILIKKVLEEKKPLVMDSSFPLMKEKKLGIALDYLLLFPVKIEEKLYGLIYLGNNAGYSSKDLEIVERLSLLFGLAVHKKESEEEIRKFNEELEEMVKKRTREIEILYEFSQKIPNIFEWTKFFELCFSYLYQVIKYDIVGCGVKIEDTLRLFIGKTSLFGEQILKEFISQMKNTLFHYNLTFTKLREEEIKFVEIDKKKERLKELNTYIHLPLKIEEKIKGFICVGFAEKKILDGYELRFFDTLTHQIALSLERLEILIKTRERELKDIIDSLPEGIIIIDEDKKIVLFNPQAEKILSPFFGLGKGEILNKIGEFGLDDILKEEKIFELKFDYPRKIILQILATSLKKGLFKKKGWVILLRDVTEQREKELYLEQQKRLALIGQLAGGIAHQFNNILNVIMVTTDAIFSADPNLSEETKTWLKNIKEEGRRAANLVYRILDFSRLSLIQKKVLDLFSFIKSLESELRKVFPSSVEIHIEAEDNYYPIEADIFLLRQLIMNLAYNSKEAMPEGGKFFLRLKKIIIDEKNRVFSAISFGKYIVLEVEDTGIGMDEETKNHAFEPFFTTKKGTTAGLGLSQVYGIVEQHKGFINLESKLGEGTKVTIYFPEYEKMEEKIEEKN